MIGALAAAALAAALQAATSHAVVLANVGEHGAADRANLDAIAASPYDVVTIDEVGTVATPERLDARAVVRRVRGRHPRRVVLGYVNIGEAEAWRTYFRPAWRVGSPSFIVATDPDGFTGDYPVRFADPAWQRIVFGTPSSLVDRALADGFDGVVLDWVAAYTFSPVLAVDSAAREHMIDFVSALSAYAKARRPGFLIVPLNAAPLLGDGRVRRAVDAVVQEDLWFANTARAEGDVATGDREAAPQRAALDAARRTGLPVFTIDYATRAPNVARAYASAQRRGYVEYVTTRGLGALSRTPPPGRR